MKRIGRIAVTTVGAWVLVALCHVPAQGQGLARGDFNGDGIRDLAVGVPDEDFVIKEVVVADAGAVNVLYGSGSAGLDAPGNEFLYQGAPDVSDAQQEGDRFGYALAAGDFNGDGYDDLAVGVPGQKIGLAAGAGAIHVFYGSVLGLISTNVFGATVVADVVWHRDSTGVRESAEALDNFGWTLAAGTFNGDKYADLAVGVPYDDPGAADAGSVHVLHGSSSGLVAADIAGTVAINEDDQVWHQDVGAISTVAEPGDHFGWVVAAGDFNGDAYSDLAIGTPGESIGLGVDPAWNAGPQDAGVVIILEGTSAGLTDFGSEHFHQAGPGLVGLTGTAELGDGFGYSLAVGDFDGNGCDDLAIGVPFEDDESSAVAIFAEMGAVHVIYGFPNGDLGYAGPQYWHQDSLTADGAMGDAREPGDLFGLSLAAGDLNGDGRADLVIGVPGEDLTPLLAAAISDAGAVNVLYGRADGGLSLAATQFWHQDSSGVTETADSGDLFAMSVVIGDFNGDSHEDLAVGVPGEGVSSAGAFREHAGAVAVLHGSSAGLRSSDDAGTLGADENDQFWHQNSADVGDSNERHDHFGGGRVGR